METIIFRFQRLKFQETNDLIRSFSTFKSNGSFAIKKIQFTSLSKRYFTPTFLGRIGMWNIFVGNCETWKYRIMISSKFFKKKMNPRKVTLCPWKRGWLEDQFHFVRQSDSSWTMAVGCFLNPLPYQYNSGKKGEHIETKRLSSVGWFLLDGVSSIP